MVFIEEEDTESVFDDASLDWYGKLAKAHIKEGNKIHPNTRNNKTEILNQAANFYQYLETRRRRQC